MMLRRWRVTPVVMSVAAGTAVAQTVPQTVPQNMAPENAVPQPEATDQQAAPQDQGGSQGMPAKMQPGKEGELDANGVYTVKKGDTLWDLSGQFLNNPWYWPKIWADNPGIENPHWIYPGNRLTIHENGGGTGEVSTQGSDSLSDSDAAHPDLPPQQADLPDVSRGTLTNDALAQDSDVEAGDLSPYHLPDFFRVRVETLITDRELADTGTITNCFEPKDLLSTYDKVYLTFKNLNKVKIGSTYSIFRTRNEVIHPITHKRFGYQTELIGQLRIIGKQGKLAVGEIGSVSTYAQRGDHITLGAALEKTVHVTPNTSTVRGVILTTQVPKLEEIGENHVVFIDKGARDGVHDGNTLRVYETGDGLDPVLFNSPASIETRTKPREAIATLLVFNVRDHSSAAMVVQSIREVNVGDIVEMHPQQVAGAGGDAR